MTKFGPLSRGLALAGLLVTFGASTGAALAAPADVQLLQSYIGEWKGRGVLTGAETESVVCKLSLAKGNGDKVVYNGRCALAGTNLAIKGTLAYVDASQQFEAAMTSNAKFTGVAVGQKSGDGVVFNLKEKSSDDDGKPMTISAVVALQGGQIGVQFNVVFNDSGDVIKASVPFTK
ncbi:MAG: hypothetical protein JWR75_551 [Devosia sp.]|nr:hypothetical protein [Devosia sp.]